MSFMDELFAISKNTCFTVSVSWISIIIVGCIYDFHVAYISFIERSKSEEWLLEHCQDDHFFHKMAYHTDVCAMVVGNSIIWPSLYGINESMSKMKLCGFYDCSTLLDIIYSGSVPVMLSIFLGCVFTPSFILPLLHCEKKLIDMSSPNIRKISSSLPRGNNKHHMYYDVKGDVNDTSNF